MPASAEIRRQFLDFFVERHAHTFVPSSPVVPHDDQTLLFANAGMNQFKDVFLGVGRREYTRAVNTQKCIRAGGKHNDLEDVGRDTYHHTFFEMLGNWSFGDYFKREAILWAWDLLTNVWGLDKRRLHATVFAGEPDQGLARDDEAAQLWRTVTDIDPSHIHFGGMKDNFWEMGETGPCGPCSEIHIDRTPDRSGRALVNRGDPRVIELWNLVFIQFNRAANGELTALPARHVDTGMGFERLCAVLQDKESNYDTDVFGPIFGAIRDVTGAAPYTGELQKPQDIAYRVIADHIRALVFALADGATPSNEGRGYVLRRILRRAARHGRQTLGTRGSFLFRLVPIVVELMSPAFPELKREPAGVAEMIREDEELFDRTLDRGIAHFNAAAAAGRISGAAAFELYATYGFPPDLTQVMAEERNLPVDMAGFEAELDRHREISRGAAGATDAKASLVDLVQRLALPATEFVGYESLSLAAARLCRLLVLGPSGQYEPADSLSTGDEGAIVVDRTPFYAEAGGQVGDVGEVAAGAARFRVQDTVKVGEVYFHLGHVDAGSWNGATEVSLRVDESRRRRTMIHHTVTHLLNHKLRAVLGDHVQQKGSLVDDAKTRFDFSHAKAMTADEIARVEAQVNADIGRDLPVFADHAAQDEARRIYGLRAVFGEKYPSVVRVVSVGVPVRDLLANPSNKAWYDYSVEFCGGTHLQSTGQAGTFVVVAEEAIAKGIRRITAVAGGVADAAQADGETVASELETLVAEAPGTLERKLADFIERSAAMRIPLGTRIALRERIAELQARIKEWKKTRTKNAESSIGVKAREMVEKAPEQRFYVEVFDDADKNALGAAIDEMRKIRPTSALMAASGSTMTGSFYIKAWVPRALTENGFYANEWVQFAAKRVGGGGGGKPDMAEAGGKYSPTWRDALEAAQEFAKKKLGAE